MPPRCTEETPHTSSSVDQVKRDRTPFPGCGLSSPSSYGNEDEKEKRKKTKDIQAQDQNTVNWNFKKHNGSRVKRKF